MDLLCRKIISMFFLLFFISNAVAKDSAIPKVCDQQYALCTSAACIPTPGSATDAICDCVVDKGKSVGYKTCKERQAYKDKYDATHLISTFSFEQFATKKPMNCPKGIAWTDCVDMPCVIDPQNAKHALCNCTIHNTQAFFTFGGDCNIKSCATGFWSGATRASGLILRNALMREITNKPNLTPKACSIKSN
jgi:hypothetical protein